MHGGEVRWGGVGVACVGGSGRRGVGGMVHGRRREGVRVKSCISGRGAPLPSHPPRMTTAPTCLSSPPRRPPKLLGRRQLPRPRSPPAAPDGQGGGHIVSCSWIPRGNALHVHSWNSFLSQALRKARWSMHPEPWGSPQPPPPQREEWKKAVCGCLDGLAAQSPLLGGHSLH